MPVIHMMFDFRLSNAKFYNTTQLKMKNMITIPNLDNGGIREAFMAYHKYLDKKAEELSLTSYKEPALPGLSSFTSDQVRY